MKREVQKLFTKKGDKKNEEAEDGIPLQGVVVEGDNQGSTSGVITQPTSLDDNLRDSALRLKDIREYDKYEQNSSWLEKARENFIELMGLMFGP